MRVDILGAGIAGLTAAYYTSKDKNICLCLIYFTSRYIWVEGHVKRWMDLYLFYYNWVRSHMTFHDNSPILARKGISFLQNMNDFSLFYVR